MTRRYLGKAIIRTRMILEKFFNFILRVLILAHIRNEAHRSRRVVARKMGRKVVTRKVRKSIKSYSKRRFGSKKYWPSLAYYSEVKGKFMEGWIPYDYFRFVLLPKLNPKPAIYMDFKTFDYQLFGDFAVKPLFLFISGMFFDADLNFVDHDQLKTFLGTYDEEIVVKKESGWGGMQVKVMHASTFEPDQLEKGSDYVIQPYVKQYKTLNDLYPHSVNTLRVNTFLEKDGSVRILSTALRFGADGGRVDNVSSGGNPLFFDLNGKPDKVTYDPVYFTETGDRHKNTGFKYADLEIPMFKEVLEKCKKAHQKVPYVRLVAWDTCIDHRGEPKLIEWNIDNPEYASLEINFGPFWPEHNEF
jgi:hypothetical protein